MHAAHARGHRLAVLSTPRMTTNWHRLRVGKKKATVTCEVVLSFSPCLVVGDAATSKLRACTVISRDVMLRLQQQFGRHDHLIPVHHTCNQTFALPETSTPAGSVTIADICRLVRVSG